MAVTAGQQQFITAYAPYAQVASQRTGVPWQAILAQWADETGFGTSRAFTQGNNFAGVSPGGNVASYPTPAAGLAAYIQTLLSPSYAAVRSSGTDPVAAAQALGRSPWAASRYDYSGGGPGSDLVAILNQTGLDTNATYTGISAGDVLGGLGGVTGAAAGVIGGAAGGAVGGAIGSTASDIANSVISTLATTIRKPVLEAVAVAAALGLVILGVWRAVSPTVKPAVDEAKQAADVAAVAA